MCFWCIGWKVLGFIIHEKGIEIDPKRIEAMKKVEAVGVYRQACSGIPLAVRFVEGSTAPELDGARNTKI